MELTDSPSPERILRLPQVKERTGLARATIYLKIKQHTFPKQINLGQRSVGWLESEIKAWIQKQIHESRNSKRI